jgi:hypothetical protein
MAGALALYQFEIIQQSAWEPDEPLRLPDLNDIAQNTIRSLSMVVAAIIGASPPLLLVAGPLLFWNEPDWWTVPLAAGATLSVILLPVNLLAVAMADSPTAVSPRFTFSALVRIPGPYVVCCLLALAVAGACAAIVSLLPLDGTGNYLANFAAATAVIYLCSVFSRALGTLHYAYEERIGWMQEID